MRAMLLFAAACGASHGSTAPVADDACGGVHAHVEQLYLQGPPGATDPKLARDVALDNTHMVMIDCARNPAQVAPCAERANTVAALEHNCVIPLDPQGTEGDRPPNAPLTPTYPPEPR
ncbi:MAG TPA: hypothetical protein VGM88_33805 [Kofleriaceae bacterium]|jgi:hypothetical protein